MQWLGLHFSSSLGRRRNLFSFPSGPDRWCVLVINKLGCHAFRPRNFQTRRQLVERFSVYVEQLQDKERTHAPIVSLAGMVSRGTDYLLTHSCLLVSLL